MEIARDGEQPSGQSRIGVKRRRVGDQAQPGFFEQVLGALLSLVIGIWPAGFGVVYAVWPTDQRLALMRPISLASIFAGLSGSLAGAINVLRMVWDSQPPVDTQVVAVGAAEALVPMFVAFGALTIAWLCAALGLRRHA